MEDIFKGISLISHGGRRSIAGTAQATPPHPPPSNTLPSYIRSRAPPPNRESGCTRGRVLLGGGWGGVAWAVPAIDLLPPWLWSEWSEWKKKWSTFGPLNFFIFRYVEGGVLGNNYISIKKCTTTFLWVLNFGQVGEILENFQKHPLGESFWKIFSKVWFWKNFKRDFPVKNEEIFFSKIFM